MKRNYWPWATNSSKYIITSVYDINGSKLIETKSKSIDMSKMSTGTYIIKTLDNESKKANSGKIIKK